MNLGTAKRQALILMREWTLDGLVIPEEDNIDYLKSAEDLASIAQMDIAKKKRIPARAKLNDTPVDVLGDYALYSTPNDFYELSKLLLEKDNRLQVAPSHLYFWVNVNTIAIQKEVEGNFILTYYRLPSMLEPDLNNIHANDSYEFEVAQDTHYLIPFFIAAQLLSDEDRGLAQVKINEYHLRLSELEDGSFQGTGEVQNVLGW